MPLAALNAELFLTHPFPPPKNCDCLKSSRCNGWNWNQETGETCWELPDNAVWACRKRRKKISSPIPSMYDIFAYIWWIFMGNVGKYTSPMDAMGLDDFSSWAKIFCSGVNTNGVVHPRKWTAVPAKNDGFQVRHLLFQYPGCYFFRWTMLNFGDVCQAAKGPTILFFSLTLLWFAGCYFGSVMDQKNDFWKAKKSFHLYPFFFQRPLRKCEFFEGPGKFVESWEAIVVEYSQKSQEDARLYGVAWCSKLPNNPRYDATKQHCLNQNHN